ncbi:MAG TPA: ABC transporter substrate-binding protein [Phycisphaerales bacterium]|nr:ABC transporter substrate-binding protein [Phycisphaerales bacterium]HRQ75891.1 ABC transporter substrate-binding protein [Phycisphaerales bacterium]
MVCDDHILIRLAHSPDPDDAFMWWPLFEVDGESPRLETGRFRFEPVTQDIETLNRRAATGELEITAMSCAQYPHVQHLYAITSCGASMGEAYGPKLVARSPLTVKALRESKPLIAIPGERTSAFAALCMMLGRDSFRHEVVPFETIIDHVAAGGFDAGLVIHEGQLTFCDAGLHLVQDMGAWWTAKTNLPMPLGINAIRRDLDAHHGEGTIAAVCDLLLQSVRYALAHRDDSIRYALRYARGMSHELADEFVGLYVNKRTIDFGETGREAVRVFLSECCRIGLTPPVHEIAMC